VSDEYIQTNGTILQPPSPQPPNGMMAVIPVVRITASIKKTLKSRTITAGTLNTYDEHFKAIMSSYPEPFAIHSTADLDPRLLTAACALQTSRFLLYRHNLSPCCRRAERRDALDRLVSVAQDTASYTQRSFNPAHMGSWAARLRTMAPAFFCAHVWRCILVLAFRAEYAAALTLLQVSAAVGDLRRNNMACGRHLSFFLDKLVERLRVGASQQQLENDEEMLAYVSGDMQGNSDNAWVWAGSDPQAISPAMTSANSAEAPAPAGNQLSDRELHEWPGWEHIQHVLTSLLHESQAQAAQQQQQQQQQQQHQQRAPPPPSFNAPQAYPSTISGGPLPPLQQQQQQHPGHLAPAPMQQRNSVSPAPGSSHSLSSGNGSGGGGGMGGGGGGGGSSSRISIKDIM
jgi:uncharacterized membrane protein YgcG